MPFILTVLHAVSRSLSLLCTAPSTPLWTHPHPHTNADTQDFASTHL
jgi:hypothetical protein